MKREMVYSFQKVSLWSLLYCTLYYSLTVQERDELAMNNKLSVEKVTRDMNEKVRKVSFSKDMYMYTNV